MLGRTFTESDYHDDGRPADNVILGWGYWQRTFGGDPSVVGRTLRSDTVSFTIVGVMPQGFRVVTTKPEVLVVARVANLLWVLMTTIGIVMVIACANVGNLMLVRAEARQQEFAVQMALGSGNARLIAGWLAESILLSLVGGAFGTGLAYAGVRLLRAFGPANMPRLPDVAVDGRVLAFALAVSIVSGLLFGLMPAPRYARRQLSGMMAGAPGASSGRDRQRTRDGLVIVQVALALVLLVSSGLMIRTFLAMRNVAPGFETARIQTMRITIPATAAPNPDQVAQTHKALLQALGTIPGVTATALTTAMPMEGLVPQGAG